MNQIRFVSFVFLLLHFFFPRSFVLTAVNMENTLDVSRHPLGRNHMAEEIFYKTMTTTSASLNEMSATAPSYHRTRIVDIPYFIEPLYRALVYFTFSIIIQQEPQVTQIAHRVHIETLCGVTAKENKSLNRYRRRIPSALNGESIFEISSCCITLTRTHHSIDN